MKTHALRIVWQGLWASTDDLIQNQAAQDRATLHALIDTLQKRQSELQHKLLQHETSRSEQPRLQRELKAVKRLLKRAAHRVGADDEA